MSGNWFFQKKKQFHFREYLFLLNFVSCQCHGNVKVEPLPPPYYFNFSLPFRKVNAKNKLSERSAQENEEDGSHGSKKKERVIQQFSSSKRGKFQKKRKATKIRGKFSSSLLDNLMLHLGGKKREVRNKVKRGKEKDSQVHFPRHHLLTAQSSKREEGNQETKRFLIV